MDVVINRKNKIKKEIKYNKSVKFLYNTFLGRVLLMILSKRFISMLVGNFMNSFLSKPLIDKHVKKYHINMNQYEIKNYSSYNDYFKRKLKTPVVNHHEKIFISPAESNLLIKKINKDLKIMIKNSLYTLQELVDDDIVNDYQDGYILIFRLMVSNYHRYCYIDSGYRDCYHHIKGELHTVQPIAYDRVKIFHRNTREWTVLHTNHFDDIVQIEVGALLVGKIINNSIIKFNKGDEKGYFEFGGSTIVLIIKKDQVKFDQDLLENSKNNCETTIKYGERIGIKLK